MKRWCDGYEEHLWKITWKWPENHMEVANFFTFLTISLKNIESNLVFSPKVSPLGSSREGLDYMVLYIGLHVFFFFFFLHYFTLSPSLANLVRD